MKSSPKHSAAGGMVAPLLSLCLAGALATGGAVTRSLAQPASDTPGTSAASTAADAAPKGPAGAGRTNSPASPSRAAASTNDTAGVAPAETPAVQSSDQAAGTNQVASPKPEGEKTPGSDEIMVSFQGAPIDMIVQWLAQNTGKSVVKHPQVQCQLTIVSSKKVKPREAINLVYRARLCKRGRCGGEIPQACEPHPGAAADRAPCGAGARSGDGAGCRCPGRGDGPCRGLTSRESRRS